MNFLSLIESKRDGAELSPDQIASIIRDYTAGRIPDYQMAAFLMAVYFRGLGMGETRALTLAMRDSGQKLQLPSDPRPVVDKHSTGGVGDKVSLPLAPLLACLGFRVPMISGRGLGITGGTLDKLESIPGFTTALELPRIIDQVQTVGCVICGQTSRMVPADKGLYALRDVTATVPSIPLITASILSKKLAEDLQALVLDVKFGAAAFMQKVEPARELARSMVSLGNECGVRARALLTNMDRPLGRAAGNWLEVRESVECLKGRGPSDLRELVVSFAAHLLLQTGRVGTVIEGAALADRSLSSGDPLRKWEEMLLAQGADLAAYKRKLEPDHTARSMRELKSARDGFLVRSDVRAIGEVVRDLGGGRLTKDTVINHDVGIDEIAALGRKIAAGDILCRIHAENAEDAERAAARLQTAFGIDDSAIEPPPLIQEIIE